MDPKMIISWDIFASRKYWPGPHSSRRAGAGRYGPG